MGFWSRLCYEFDGRRKATNIKIHFELKTTSGYTLFEHEEELKPKKLYILKDNTYYGHCCTNIENDYKNYANKSVNELLTKHRKIGRVKLPTGEVVNGKHIVGCTWVICFDVELLTYEEYLRLKRENVN